MNILAIETSCDETAISLVEAKGGLKRPEFKIISQEISSQIKLHAPYGGVVPMLAKREHAKNLPLLLKKTLNKSLIVDPSTKKQTPNIDLIAVTVGPGLEPALWEGINFAQNIAANYQKPIIGINHLEGHIYSNWMEGEIKPKLPAVCLIVSGGHTILTFMDKINNWQILGSTRDDAVGEAFDKVARMLSLPYPGGPAIEKLAKLGNPNAILLPRPMLSSGDYDFSFSGLKTAVLYYLKKNPKSNPADLAASFIAAAFEVLIIKTLRSAKANKAKSVLICGGVASNKTLRSLFKKEATKQNLFFYAPALKLNTDNASMIAAAAYIKHLNLKKGTGRALPLQADGNLGI